MGKSSRSHLNSKSIKKVNVDKLSSISEERIRELAKNILNENDDADMHLADDESINEDDAFDSEDEKKWGHFFADSKSQNGNRKVREEDSDLENDVDDDYDEEVTLLDVLDTNQMKHGTSRATLKTSTSMDEPETLDDETHSKLLFSILGNQATRVDNSTKMKLPKRKRSGMSEVREESAVESEFAFSTSGKKRSLNSDEVNLDALMSSLDDSNQHGALKKRLERLTGSNVSGKRSAGSKAGVLSAPLSKSVVEKTERNVAYSEVANDMKKWTGVVQINRQADHLSFTHEAMVSAPSVQISSSSLVSKFTPENEFEAAIAEALASSGMGPEAPKGSKRVQINNEAVLTAEETELPDAGISHEQLQARQAQLMKLRSLMFFEEQKKRRQNKIKSKAYRALKGRVDTRQGEAERELLKQIDPEASLRLEEDEAKLAIKERMTLKHRAGKGIGGSKWIKKVLSRERGDETDSVTREAITQHLQRAEEMKKKMKSLKKNENESDDDDGDEGLFYNEGGEVLDPEKIIANAREKILEIGRETSESEIPAKGLMAMKFMKTALDKKKAELEAESVELASVFNISNKKSNGADGSAAFENVDWDEMEFQSGDKGNGLEPAPGRKVYSGVVSNPTPKEKSKLSKSSTNKEDESISAKSTLTVKVNQAISVPSRSNNEADSENPWLANNFDSSATTGGRHKATIRAIGGEKDKKVVATLDVSSTIATLPTSKRTNSKGNSLSTNVQEELIRRAFVGDEVVEDELIRDKEQEKEEILEEERKEVKGKKKPQLDISSNLQGWGSWAGLGVSNDVNSNDSSTGLAKLKKTRGSKLSQAIESLESNSKNPKGGIPSAMGVRKDNNLKHVMITEKRDKKFAVKNMTGAVPFPFSSKEQYEASLRHPLGSEWNTLDVTADATKPEWTTRAGLIIEPIKLVSIKRNEPTSSAIAKSAVALGGMKKAMK
jgi:U3 small nucleolar RNA-associated protein 14